MRSYTKELKDDIKKFILSNNSIQHRTNLLNEILVEYLSLIDDDRISELEDIVVNQFDSI